MELIVDTSQGWTNAIIEGNCEFNHFYKIAEDMAKHFNIAFTDKLKDFDSVYWDFDYKSSKLSLQYNIYLGISIFPLAFKNASPSDNEHVLEIANALLQKLLADN
jgi:Protein of unknown function (DUF3630)